MTSIPIIRKRERHSWRGDVSLKSIVDGKLREDAVHGPHSVDGRPFLASKVVIFGVNFTGRHILVVIPDLDMLNLSDSIKRSPPKSIEALQKSPLTSLTFVTLYTKYVSKSTICERLAVTVWLWSVDAPP